MGEFIEHADAGVAHHPRPRRPTLAKTLCNRWVDHMRIALTPDRVTCSTCLKRRDLRRTCDGCGQTVPAAEVRPVVVTGAEGDFCAACRGAEAGR